MAVTIRLFAMYELASDGTGATGLTVTVDVDKFAKSDGTRTRVTTAGSAVEGANGVYHYAVANVSDLATHDYIAVFKTSATTVKTKHFAFLLQDLIAAASQVMSNLDAAVSTVGGASAAEVNTQVDLALSDVGVTSIRMAKLDTISASSVILADPFDSAEDIRVQLGNDYYAVDGRALEFTGTAWPVLTGGVVSFVAYGAITTTITGTVLSSNSCRIELSKANIAAIGVGFWNYTLKVVLSNTHTVTLVNGTIAVMEL